MSVVLKELRKTQSCLKIIHKAKLYLKEEYLIVTEKENNGLISIFVKSLETSKMKLK